MNFTTIWLLLMVFVYEQAVCKKEYFITDRCFPSRKQCAVFCISECRKIDYQTGNCWRFSGNLCAKTYKHSWLPWICGCTGENAKDTWHSDVEGTRVYKDIPETGQMEFPPGME